MIVSVGDAADNGNNGDDNDNEDDGNSKHGLLMANATFKPTIRSINLSAP